MDLERLKIDRGAAYSSAATSGPIQARRGVPWGWLFVAFGLTALVLLWPQLSRWKEQRFAPRVRAAEAILLDTLTRGAVEGTAANGYVVASRRAALSADTPGRIVEMRVTEGDFVKKDKVVARLYSDEYAAQLSRAEAQLTVHERSIERAVLDVETQALEVVRSDKSAQRQQALHEEAIASWNLAVSDFERARKLLDSGVWNQQMFDDAQTQQERAIALKKAAGLALEEAQSAQATSRSRLQTFKATQKELEARRPVLEAERDAARATLDKTEVRAPFDGIVVLKDAEVGEVVSPNSQGGGSSRGSVVTMVDFDSLEVQVDVPESNLSLVTLDAPTSVFLDARPSFAYPGRVARIWPTADRQKATVEVRVQLLERDDYLRPEMGARVVFDPKASSAEGGADSQNGSTNDEEPALVIPRNSVIQQDQRTGVFVVARGVANFRELQLGPERGGRPSVVAGLSAGERVILDPPADLKDGQAIRLETE